MPRPLAIAAAVLLAVPLGAAPAAAITGHYLEARTADVYTGPCFANSEVGLTGKEAILAWGVTEGAWDGVDLAGLAVAAVVTADATFGDPHAGALGARSLLFVDDDASPEQHAALVSLARELGGATLGTVEAVAAVPVELAAGAPGFATLRAGADVELATRALNHGDHLCGNETVYYDPLTAAPGAVPAVTLVHRFAGPGLGTTWSSPGKRSAFVGAFAR